MKMAFILFVVALALGAAPESEKEETLAAFKSGEIQWAEESDGRMSRLQHGDPAKEPSLALLKIPAGTLTPPHFHTADEVATVVSGKILIGSGEKVVEAKGKEIDASGYFVIPGGTPHWGKAQTDVVLVRYSSGPRDITYVNPGDDPVPQEAALRNRPSLEPPEDQP
ncbi:MAG: cupin domain-containing protein [Acidobacteriota bacterium]